MKHSFIQFVFVTVFAFAISAQAQNAQPTAPSSQPTSLEEALKIIAALEAAGQADSGPKQVQGGEALYVTRLEERALTVLGDDAPSRVYVAVPRALLAKPGADFDALKSAGVRRLGNAANVQVGELVLLEARDSTGNYNIVAFRKPAPAPAAPAPVPAPAPTPTNPASAS